ncbi:MAG: lipoate--protein ligase family protein [Thermomicrobiales bacterium]
MTGLQPGEIKRRWTKQEWQLLPPTPLSPMIHTALDETLTLRVGRGDRLPTLRIWQWSGPCVVLGRFQSVRNEVNADVLAENGFDLVRRISGGGAMFIQPEGAITYSIYAPEEMAAGMSFPESYAFFDAWVIDALRELGVEARYAPLNDITSTNGKIGGAAQARRGGAILHHATMAYQMDGPLMSKILRTGKEKLSDKGVQSADKRVAPLLQQTALDRDVIIHHLIGHFRARFGLVDGELDREELDEAEQAVATRFGTHEWVYFLP